MDNHRTTTVTPGQASDYIISQGENVPAEYIVNADGTVSPIPVTGSKRKAARSPIAPDGKERRFVFVKRMNSAAAALWLDQLLGSVAVFQFAIVLALVFAFSGQFDLDTLNGILESSMTGTASYPEPILLLVLLANMLATPVAHMLPAYLHSVRNNFSIMSTLKPGRKLGLTLPAAAVVALGLTYMWVFAYLLFGWLAPDSFFANTDLFSGSFSGISRTSAIISAITTAVLAPITEEFLFRGALLKSFSKYGVPFAVAASSILFGLMHGNMLQAPFAAMGGVVLAYVAIRSGSILPCIFIHFSINVFSTVCELLVSEFPRYAGEVYYGFYGFAGVLVLATIIILCTCAKKITWKPIDAASNNILLPEVKTKVRCKFLRMVLSIGMLTLIGLLVLAILIQCGVFNDLLSGVSGF